MKSLIKSLLESLYVGLAIEIFIGYIVRPLEEGIDDKEEVKTAPQTLVISKNDLDWNYLYWNDCYLNNLYWNYLYRKDLYWIHFKTPSNDKEEVSIAPQTFIISKIIIIFIVFIWIIFIIFIFVIFIENILRPLQMIKRKFQQRLKVW